MQSHDKHRAIGQGMVEYALLIGLISLVVVLGLTASGQSVSGVFARIFVDRATDAEQVEANACRTIAKASDDWVAIEDAFWKGGIEAANGRYDVCPLCGGLLPTFSGDDYQIDLSGIRVINTTPTWNGYGVTFRSTYGPKGLNGYMFEIERINSNTSTEIYFSKWVNGKQIKPAIRKLQLPAGIDWNNPPAMSVRVEGDSFTAYMNGRPVLKASDSTYTQGGAGVIANAGTQVSFDAFRVDTPVCGEVQ